MALSLYRIKKWSKMILGKSDLYVCQDEGKCYSITEIKGYYNNLTEKVTKYGVGHGKIPTYPNEKGEIIEFSIGIFQYGLACYDLYLLNNDQSMLEDAILCGNWALEKQREDGSWVCFGKDESSAMAQGEAISLMARLYITTKDEKYLNPIVKAKDYMVKPISEGGVAEYVNGRLVLYESLKYPPIMNGWIFSLWGLLDYCKLFPEDVKTKELYDGTVSALADMLPQYDNGYWTTYHTKGMVASPFYHGLHIHQMNAMYKLSSDERFKLYAEKWTKYQQSFWNRKKAFIVKAFQKVFD